MVTARAAVGTDEDDPLLLAALACVGAEVVVVPWDDRSVKWETYDLAVIRSTWDYALRHNEFLDWAGATAAVTRLRNGPDVLAWNTDKAYLAELAAAGVPVVPTAVLHPGDDPRLPEEGEYVIKPAVGAGSVETARYSQAEGHRARSHVRRLLDAGRDVLVQPYQASVDERGETALLFVDGRYSHAARRARCCTLAAAPAPGRGSYSRRNRCPRRSHRRQSSQLPSRRWMRPHSTGRRCCTRG